MPDPTARAKRPVNTFSIVGFDPATGDLGVAIQSKFLAVGAVVPWAKAGIGAIATQSWANTSFGPRGLELLAAGSSPEETIATLTEADDRAQQRQVGIVDARGHSATYTGSECNAWAGGIAGVHFSAQGNILVGAATVNALAETFQQSTGKLWHRLIAALAAAQRAGGDSRGQQSAALLVVREGGGYGGFNDRMLDLRVDEHPHPIDELARILAIWELLFLKPAPEDYLPIDGALAAELQRLLTRAGDYKAPPSGMFDAATFEALERYGGRENLEERLLHSFNDARIDRHIVDYLRSQYP
ncbi:MAG TPA: DUF1028 domain-containing protein [Ktedonobacterales bacterium]|nr:DUF1028 domain-containing protein [Ktedonobacterales bacterium]